jgi:hypothetical protein
VGSSGVMGTLSWLSVSGTNIVDLAEWLERLTANAVVASVLGLIPASWNLRGDRQSSVEYRT